LEPIPDSWKEKPKNFVMVGLQGVVSSEDGLEPGQLVYAGAVPIFGCDSFNLRSKVRGPFGDDSENAEHSTYAPAWHNTPWNGALLRLSQLIDETRERWRAILHRIIKEKSTKKSASTTKEQVTQLLQAARASGVLSFEMTTADGEEIVVKLG